MSGRTFLVLESRTLFLTSRHRQCYSFFSICEARALVRFLLGTDPAAVFPCCVSLAAISLPPLTSNPVSLGDYPGPRLVAGVTVTIYTLSDGNAREREVPGTNLARQQFLPHPAHSTPAAAPFNSLIRVYPGLN